MATIHRIKAALKHGPSLSRQLRTEFALAQVDGAPRRLRPEVLVKIQAEVQRLSKSTDPRVQRFVRTMRQKYPEVQV